MAERTLLRIGAMSAVVGVITLFTADAFHGGHDPADLEAVLPEYAANANWEVVHIGQFLGYVLVLVGLVALHRSIAEGRGAALARLGYVTALVATAVYAANQAVDGVAIKFVADEWVSAPAEEKADALRLAEAVRHIEIGLTSFAEVTWGGGPSPLRGGDRAERGLSQMAGMGGGGGRARMERARAARGP